MKNQSYLRSAWQLNAAGVESGFRRDGRPQEVKNTVLQPCTQSTLSALTGKVVVVVKGRSQAENKWIGLKHHVPEK